MLEPEEQAAWDAALVLRAIVDGALPGPDPAGRHPGVAGLGALAPRDQIRTAKRLAGMDLDALVACLSGFRAGDWVPAEREYPVGEAIVARLIAGLDEVARRGVLDNLAGEDAGLAERLGGA